MIRISIRHYGSNSHAVGYASRQETGASNGTVYPHSHFEEQPDDPKRSRFIDQLLEKYQLKTSDSEPVELERAA